jgi:hypothetical protein
MKPKFEAYLVISDRFNPEWSFEKNLRETTYYASNFKKAYSVINELGVSNPNRGYKASLLHVNNKNVVTIKDKDNDTQVTIVKVKKII